VPALTDADFDREVIGAQGTVLVDFWRAKTPAR
jgi:hypothetical protein